jgi:transcriptional regulator with XRE-family HTH domain
MSTDQGPVVLSALLRGELVVLRKESGLTQEQVATELDWSPSKLIRVEGGRSSVTKVDLNALLDVYKVTSESRRERLQALNKGARERSWWDGYRDISPAYLNYVGFEAGAAFIRQFELGYIPGLLQTAEYAEAVTVKSIAGVRVASIVKLRLQRQAELARRSSPPRQYYVVDEAVLRRHIGLSKDPAIMPNQLSYLADKAENDDLITVRVIPFAAGAHRGLSGPFTLLEFDGGLADILYIDAGRAAFATMVSGGEPQVAEFRDDFETLLEDALPADKSIKVMRDIAEELS